jgi:transposase
MWLTGRLMPDHKTIADFRKDNGGAWRLAQIEESVALSVPARQR